MKLFLDTSKLDELRNGSQREWKLKELYKERHFPWGPQSVWGGGKDGRGLGVRIPGRGPDLSEPLPFAAAVTVPRWERKAQPEMLEDALKF